MISKPTLGHAAAFSILYRDMGAADLPFLEQLYRSTREGELAMTPWSDEEKTSFIAMQFRAQHEHYQAHYPDALWLVIEQNMKAIGRLYIEAWPKEHRIIDIALMPEARGQGIGEAILRDLISDAQAQGKGVGIHVEKNNPAMSLYKRLGFEKSEDKGVYDLMHKSPLPASHLA